MQGKELWSFLIFWGQVLVTTGRPKGTSSRDPRCTGPPCRQLTGSHGTSQPGPNQEAAAGFQLLETWTSALLSSWLSKERSRCRESGVFTAGWEMLLLGQSQRASVLPQWGRAGWKAAQVGSRPRARFSVQTGWRPDGALWALRRSILQCQSWAQGSTSSDCKVTRATRM